MNKQDIVATLRRALTSLAAMRRDVRTNPTRYEALMALKRFQAERMACTHADLLARHETARAARFFLDDLYGAFDVSRRDADIERIIPTMERLLPAAALQTVAEAIMLDALSERLDAIMAARLGAEVDVQRYAAAYREMTNRSDRERQLVLVQSVGDSLSELVRIPLIGGTLALMRRPAEIAKLGELHDFLNRGFTAFKSMKDPHAFVDTVVQRETRIMQKLYAGVRDPFSPDAEN